MCRAWHGRPDQSRHFWHHPEMTLGESESGETGPGPGPSSSPPAQQPLSREWKAGSPPPGTQPGLESDSDLMSDS